MHLYYNYQTCGDGGLAIKNIKYYKKTRTDFAVCSRLKFLLNVFSLH